MLYRSIIDLWSEEWLLYVGYDRFNFMYYSNDNKRIFVLYEDKLLVKNVNIVINIKFKKDYVGVEYYILGWFVVFYYFVFVSEYDMMKWFIWEECEELVLKGFYFVVYEVLDD